MPNNRTDQSSPKTFHKRQDITVQKRDKEQSDYRKYEYQISSYNNRNAAENKSKPYSDQNQYILTGRNPIREALKNHHDLEKLLVQKGELSGSAKEIVQKAKEQKVQIQIVEKNRLDEITPHHQGLIAFASAYQYSSVEEIIQTAEEKGEEPFLILLDGITDPHNLGAIIRTAECAGVHGIIVPQHHSVGLSPAAVKASAGAIEYIKVARVTNLSRTIENLKKHNIWVYAVTMNGIDYRKTDFRGGVALVIGSEEDGISRLVGEKCDYSVSLPMVGKIESLNASVAAGIMMYQVFSCRQ
jgi:23S rRNA (guanosine2251-2'-O)-methyltransferase